MRRFIIAVLLGLMIVLPMTSAPAGATTGSDEAAFVDRVNSLRASKGLGPLTVDGGLVEIARRWSAKMAADDAISHNANFAGEVAADWQKLGENVGVGMTVDGLHEAFVNSPSHYRNLVDGDFTHVGVGVVYGRDGAIFTAHQFMTLAAPAPAPAPEPAPAPAPAPAPEPAPAPAPAAAASSPTAAAPATKVASSTAAEPRPVPSARVVFVLEQLAALHAG